MEEQERKFLAYEITNLELVKRLQEKSLELLNDVEDTDEIYKQIHSIAEDVNDLKMEKEVKFEEAEL